ncbi:MAG: hypothetical protein HXK67_05480 [Clostridiales bacterium]|jgi:hypothetical protein|nr:hypothetical protein [Clostridiales bacterium]
MEEILTLDQIVTKFVKDESNKEYIEFLEQKIIPICEKILSKQPQKLEKRNWSRKVDINESIENVYQFLKQEINPYFANQFMNIIRQERYGNIKVNILPRSEYKDKNYYFNEVDKKGKVHIYFNETPYDMFSIIHEMIHKMNETYEIIDNEKYKTELAQYFAESPSMMAEKLLGKWLVKNKKITHNDLKIVENERLKDSKFFVKEILIEYELIKMKQAGEELTPENILKRLTDRANHSPETIAKIFKHEIKEPTIINGILLNQTMGFIASQQYIMGQHLSDNLKNRENPNFEFIYLHYKNGNKNSKVEDVIERIDDFITDPNKIDEKTRIIDKVVSEYIKDPSKIIYRSNLEQIKEMCEEVLRQPYPKIETEEWSREIDINESIEYNYKFLKTISSMLAEQFMNLLNQYDENGKAVSILPFSDEYKCIQYTNEGKVFVYYKNTPEDIFTLLHEMIHAMNYSSKTTGRTDGQSYISEVPTHIIENLLGKWLVKNKLITQNDYNKYKKWRLEHSKKVSCGVLIEKELIDMKLKKGLYITRPRVIGAIERKCHIKDPKIFSEEESEYCYTELDGILNNKELKFEVHQRYVIGQYIADKVDKEKNPEKSFLRFHDLAGNVNLSPGEALRIIEEYQEEKDR